jgi:glycosyltransferase involved in cell wall biosynthesis
MNICFLTKYPPIEGGVSMRCYWLARGLAERGHKVVVVTNAREIESEYRIQMTDDDRAWYESTFPATGGAVIVRNTTPPSDRLHYIPYANPYVTKLATVATRSITEHECTSIFAYYLEPYGVAAYLASQWTDTPYVVRHAGSDLGRLMKDPELHGAYREVFRRAHSVSSGMREPLTAMGVDPERIWTLGAFPVQDIFSPEAAPADLASLVAHRSDVFQNDRPIDPSVPTIGIYGKVGPSKGSYDLLFALSASPSRRGRRWRGSSASCGSSISRIARGCRRSCRTGEFRDSSAPARRSASSNATSPSASTRRPSRVKSSPAARV